MENVWAFLRTAMPWISLGLLVAFFCVRSAVNKNKPEDNYATERMCIDMCTGMAIGSLIGNGNWRIGTSLGMLIGLAIDLCVHKKGKEESNNEK